MPGHCTFHEKWLRDPNFGIWIAKDPDSVHSARCTFCMKSFSIGSIGQTGLTNHARGTKHKKTDKKF